MKIGLGTAQLGFRYGINNSAGIPNERTTDAILDKAHAFGIKSLDTAPVYGASEERIGNYTKRTKNLFSITTKLKPFAAETPNQLCSMLTREIDASRKRLNVDIIDCILIHDFSFLERWNFALVDCLKELTEKNIIVSWGTSVYSESEAAKSLEHNGLSTIQAPFNILDQRLMRSGMLKKIKGQRSEGSIQFQARSVFLQGLLLMEERQCNIQDAKKYLKQLDEIAASLGISRKELAYYYVRNCEYVDKLLVGIETVEQLDEIIEIERKADGFLNIDENISQTFGSVSESVIDPRRWTK